MALLRAPAFTLMAAACVLGGCGAADTAHQAARSLDPVAEAAAATAKQEGGIVMEARVSSDDPTAGAQAMTFSGTMGRLGHRGLLHVAARTKGQSVRFDMILDHNVTYAHYKGAIGALPGASKWIKDDSTAEAKASGTDAASLESVGSNDPLTMLSFLNEVGHSTKLEQKTIDGRVTTHYVASMDIIKAAERSSSPNTVKTMAAAARRLNTRTLPVEVWIDAQHLVRRELVVLSGTGSGYRLRMTIDFPRYGVPVAATPPPASQTITSKQWDRLLRQKRSGSTTSS